MAVEICSADHMTPLYLQKLALTLPTSGGCSVVIVRSRTKATEVIIIIIIICKLLYNAVGIYDYAFYIFHYNFPIMAFRTFVNLE
jgi:hypothetical protein